MVLGMSLPKELAGPSASEGMNPEQLFAMGYSACYGQAIIALAKKHGVDGSRASVTCEVTLNKDETSFALTVALKVSIPARTLPRSRRSPRTPTRSALIRRRLATTSP